MKKKPQQHSLVVKKNTNKKVSASRRSKISQPNIHIDPLVVILGCVLFLVALTNWISRRSTIISNKPIFLATVSPTPTLNQVLIGNYRAIVTAGKNANRLLSLNLSDTLEATFSQEYLDTKSVRTESGNWKIDGNQLVVELTSDEEGVLPEVKTIEFKVVGEALQMATSSQIGLLDVTINLKKKDNLGLTKWKWEKTVMKNDAVIVPDTKQSFGIQFDDANNLTITTDCNSGRATYASNADSLTFSPIVSTKMFCKDSKEVDFITQLTKVERFVNQKQRLLLYLEKSAGTMTFVAVE
jgi:heat shock protein HslJ